MRNDLVLHDDVELREALKVATDASQNGSRNGRAVAQRVISILVPILLKSPDPRIKALGIALGIGGEVFLRKSRKRIGAK